MLILNEFDVHEILPFIGLNKRKKIFEFEGLKFKIHMSSTRLECFKRSLKCVSCGIIGNKFRLESYIRKKSIGCNCFINKCKFCQFKKKSRFDNPHINLYCVIGNKSILMTQDHIIPKSKNGSDDMVNLQTMCVNCNSKKGNKLVVL